MASASVKVPKESRLADWKAAARRVRGLGWGCGGAGWGSAGGVVGQREGVGGEDFCGVEAAEEGWQVGLGEGGGFEEAG